MDLTLFHTSLLGTDPTPEQKRLYAVFPKLRGYDGDQQEPDRFVATLIAALSETWDPESKASIHTVSLAIPRVMEPWCMTTINQFVEKMRARRKFLPKAAITQFVQAVKHVETGTRIFSVSSAPKRWLAFGFTKDSAAPDWLKDGLM